MIELLPYQDRWPPEFAQIGARLRKALGNLALRIDHIGSTSVPGLAAKDVIDVQVTVAALDERIASAMTSRGYVQRIGYRDHRPPGSQTPDTDWEKLFFQQPEGQRTSNVHVRIQGRANQRYALLFRDYLRAHPESAAAYAELKRRLAAHLPDTAIYADVKDPACDLIMCAAESWVASDWAPGASDA